MIDHMFDPRIGQIAYNTMECLHPDCARWTQHMEAAREIVGMEMTATEEPCWLDDILCCAGMFLKMFAT